MQINSSATAAIGKHTDESYLGHSRLPGQVNDMSVGVAHPPRYILFRPCASGLAAESVDPETNINVIKQSVISKLQTTREKRNLQNLLRIFTRSTQVSTSHLCKQKQFQGLACSTEGSACPLQVQRCCRCCMNHVSVISWINIPVIEIFVCVLPSPQNGTFYS